MKRYRFTLTAVLVFLALLAWVLTQERGRVPEKGEVFRLPTARINKLEISRDDTSIVLERQGERWYLTQPFEALADPDEVSRMIDAVAQLKPDVRPDADVTNPEFGLQTPTLTVTFHTTSAKSTTIKLGAQTLVGSKQFATLSGYPGLYLVDTGFQTTMATEAKKLRDKKLVRLERKDVRKITIERAGTTIIADRTKVGDEEVWHLRQPIETKADQWAVNSIVDELTQAEAIDFVTPPEDMSAVGLDKPQAVVTLEQKNGEKLTIRIGKQIEKEVAKEYGEGTETKRVVYVQTEAHPQLLLVDDRLMTEVGKEIFDLRDKTILQFAQGDVITLKVQAKVAASFEVRKNQDDEWIFQAPAGARADSYKIDAMLWDLTDLEARAFEEEQPTDLQKYGLTVPTAVITLTIRGQHQPLEVTFGKKSAQGYYCRTSASAQVYQVNDRVLSALPKTIEELSEESSLSDE